MRGSVTRARCLDVVRTGKPTFRLERLTAQAPAALPIIHGGFRFAGVSHFWSFIRYIYIYMISLPRRLLPWTPGFSPLHRGSFALLEPRSLLLFFWKSLHGWVLFKSGVQLHLHTIKGKCQGCSLLPPQNLTLLSVHSRQGGGADGLPSCQTHAPLLPRALGGCRIRLSHRVFPKADERVRDGRTSSAVLNYHIQWETLLWPSELVTPAQEVLSSDVISSDRAIERFDRRWRRSGVRGRDLFGKK